MAQIKTALELALERTKDIQGDRSSLEAKEYREQGMRLLAKAEAEPDLDIKAALAKYRDEKLEWVREGIRQNLFNYIALPQSKESVSRLRAVTGVFLALTKRPQEVQQYLGQIAEFLETYLENRDQLVQAVRQQFEPTLRQKEEQMARQTGRRTRIAPETDPEFNAFLGKNLDNLQKQFHQGLDQARQELSALINT